MSREDLSAPGIVIGTIGGDSHVVGVKILGKALEEAGFRVSNLGAMVPKEDFIKAAIETNADAILVSSLSGNGEFYCRGLRALCQEAGLGHILLYVGGNISMGPMPWPEVEAAFRGHGFNRVYPPQVKTGRVIADLRADLRSKAEAGACS